MEVKKIVEGMTAPEVAQVIDANFNALNGEKATVEAVADVQKNVNWSDDNTGILSYPVFDDTEPVAVGDVRRYEGLLYRAKEAGAHDWDPEKWERVTLKQLEDEKLAELGSEVQTFSLIGEGQKGVYRQYKGCIPGHIYKVIPKSVEWDFDEVNEGSVIFELYYKKTDGSIVITEHIVTNKLPSEFIFNAPNDIESFFIYIRANTGVELIFNIIDVTETMELKPFFNVNSLRCKGDNGVFQRHLGVIPKHTYRVQLNKTDWGKEEIAVHPLIFELYSKKTDGTFHVYKNVGISEIVNQYYDITIVEDLEYNGNLYVWICGNVGEEIIYTIQDITKPNYVKSLETILDVNEKVVEEEIAVNNWIDGAYKGSLSNFTPSTTSKTALLNIDEGVDYRIQGKKTSSRYRVFNSLGAEIQKNGDAYFSFVQNGVFTMPENAAYFQINCILASEKTSEIKVYKQADTEMDSRRIEQIEDVTNTLQGEEQITDYTLVNGYVVTEGGNFGNFGSSEVNKRTDYVYIKGATYVRLIQNLGVNPANNTGVVIYDENKKPIVGYTSPYNANQESLSYVERVYSIPKDGVYLAATIHSSFEDIFYMYINRIKTYTYDDVAKKVNSVKDITWNKRYSNCKFWGEQKSADGSGESFVNINGSYQNLIDTIYEPLRSKYPNYIKRESMGKDASGVYDMWCYTFEPRYYQQCVILNTGVHSKEVDSMACLARIMQMIANEYEGVEDLTFLRYNVKFIVIPCVNVWGYSQTPKEMNNYSGVKMQNWNVEPLIPELANIKNYLQDKVKEVSFLVDMHTTTADNYYDFYGVINSHAPNVRTLFRVNNWLCEHYALNGRTVDDQYFGYRPVDNHTLNQYFNNVMGVPSSTLELSDYHWDTKLSTSKVITMGVTMYLNYIIQQCNDFYKSMYDIPDEDYRESKG